MSSCTGAVSLISLQAKDEQPHVWGSGSHLTDAAEAAPFSTTIPRYLLTHLSYRRSHVSRIATVVFTDGPMNRMLVSHATVAITQRSLIISRHNSFELLHSKFSLGALPDNVQAILKCCIAFHRQAYCLLQHVTAFSSRGEVNTRTTGRLPHVPTN